MSTLPSEIGILAARQGGFTSLELPAPLATIEFHAWELTLDNPCSTESWTVSNQGRTLRFDFVDSVNCGGTCDSEQSGEAVLQIPAGECARTLTFDVSGVVENENSGFDVANVFLNGVPIMQAEGKELGQQCVMGEPTINYPEGQSVTLAANESYTLFVKVDSMDPNYHVDAFYLFEFDIVQQ